MKLVDCFCGLALGDASPLKHGAHALQHLALPLIDLRWMQTMSCRQFRLGFSLSLSAASTILALSSTLCCLRFLLISPPPITANQSLYPCQVFEEHLRQCNLTTAEGLPIFLWIKDAES
jgi:hypothetical protein